MVESTDSALRTGPNDEGTEVTLVPAGVTARDLSTTRGLAWFGLLSVWVATIMIAALHVLPPSSALDPMSHTISEYELLSTGWVFNVGVAVLAAGSLALLLGLIQLELVNALSWATAMLTLWCIGLIGLIVFPKQGFGPDSTLAGRVHWSWTLIAFFSLPIGAALVCLRRDRQNRRGWPRTVLWCCLLSAFFFAVLAVQTALGALTTWHIWNFVGLVERAVSVCEMVAVAGLAAWVLTVVREAQGREAPPLDRPEIPIG